MIGTQAVNVAKAEFSGFTSIDSWRAWLYYMCDKNLRVCYDFTPFETPLARYYGVFGAVLGYRLYCLQHGVNIPINLAVMPNVQQKLRQNEVAIKDRIIASEPHAVDFCISLLGAIKLDDANNPFLHGFMSAYLLVESQLDANKLKELLG